MYIWIHDKYSSSGFKQRLWQRKIVLIWQINFFKSCVSLWYSGQGVAWTCTSNRFRLPATLFLFLCTVFFSVWSIFPFDLFFFILTADPAGHALGSIYILSLRPEFYSLNFIRLLRVVITPSVTSSLRGENDSKQSDEFQARSFILEKGF